LFYLASTLLLPARSLLRRVRGQDDPVTWRHQVHSVLIAVGIIGGLWLSGWLLGLIVPDEMLARVAGGERAASGVARNAIRVATLAMAVGTLAFVLVAVEVAHHVRACRAQATAGEQGPMSRLPQVPAVRLCAAALCLVAAPLSAQTVATSVLGATLRRADSAWERGDLAQARGLYSDVLIRDSTQSRAVFRLAQLDASEAHALSLYRRYIALEPETPGDTWRKATCWPGWTMGRSTRGIRECQGSGAW
jgi:hypothetical protein